MDLNTIPAAIREAIKQAGGQVPLSESSGVSQGQISDYICGRRKVENMTLGTFAKLFPDSVVFFFGKPENPQGSDPFAGMEARLLEYFRRLTPAQKTDCLILFGKNFGESLK